MTVPFHLVDIDVFVVECQECDVPEGIDYALKRNFLKAFFAAHGYEEILYIKRSDFVYKKKRS